MGEHDPLLDRLRALDPADPDTVDRAAAGSDRIYEGIVSSHADEIDRRRSRRRLTAAVGAVAAAAAVLIPLILLSPLAKGPEDVGPSVAAPGPSGASGPGTVSPEPPGPIEVTSPTEGSTVASPLTVRGTADVFEATVSIRVLDATNNVVADTVTMATCGTGCRGDFSADVPFEVGQPQSGVLEVFEVSAKDGSAINVVRIPVTLVPGPPDPVASEVEGPWTDAAGSTLPDGTDGPLVLHVFEGADHCGWTSVTLLDAAWPPGSETVGGHGRQYLRDPHGVLRSSVRLPFDATAELPADARDTGLRRGDWHLWVAPSDSSSAVYVVEGDPASGTVERWPRAIHTIGCD